MDTLAYVRTQALSLTYSLLREKPEQEHNLLRLLVNKLVGHGDSKVSAIH
jgi:ribosome biogenesis protein MAK21